jgi:beta-N-acetylhexosaminidase
MAEIDLSVPELCGQLLLGGFDGASLDAGYGRELAAGRRAGAVLFARNVEGPAQVAALSRAIADAAPPAAPPLVAVDQEGGRVCRLRAPFTVLPPARRLGEIDDLALTEAAAEQVGRELAAVGINFDFAPVVDVDSNPQNPVIGDRSFGRDPRTVMRHGVAFLRGLQAAGVLACAKHFPGHGDTSLDSHLDLPRVEHARDRLRAVELPPFHAASGAGVAAMMTAHVVYDALEPLVPATFSRAVCASLLRAEMGFEGVLVSDDLEMGAVTRHGSIEDAAVEALWAGCDLLLVCSSAELQCRAHEALVRRAEGDARFRDRCRQAAERVLRIRRLCPPRPAAAEARDRLLGGEAARALAERIERATLSLRKPDPGAPGT